jgi:hypothetical protein
MMRCGSDRWPNLLLEATGAAFFVFGGCGRFAALRPRRRAVFSASASVSRWTTEAAEFV